MIITTSIVTHFTTFQFSILLTISILSLIGSTYGFALQEKAKKIPIEMTQTAAPNIPGKL